MDNNRKISKFQKQFNKNSLKLLKNLPTDFYIKTLGLFQGISVTDGVKDLFVTTTYFANISTRRTLVNTLKSINYVRDGEWVEQVAIAFMEEVIDLYTNEGNDEIIKQREQEISKRYNVNKNRLKTQLALFLNNYDKGVDKFNIALYFSEYELVKWKHRDLDKLQEDIENDKISDWDKKLLRDLNVIV